MKSQGLDRLFSLFLAAKEVERDARSVYVREACEGDLSLADRVKQLLKEDESAEGFLSRPPGIVTRAFPFGITEGSRLGRYTLATLVGRGGMGEVWKAYDNELHRPVALKFLAAGLPLEYLTREARLASSLNHPGIVTVHDVMEWQGVPILIMELIEGRSLSLLTSSAQPLGELLPLAAQIAEALAAAHASGIIHGDLKPDNILVRHDGIVKILDFGLARKIAAEDLAAAGMLGGTLRYMSPEQARGEVLKPATDVYALGLVLFELATGRHPLGRQRLDEDSASRMPKASTVHPHVPPALDALIEGMLRVHAGERPPVEAVAASLRRLQRPAVSHGLWLWATLSAALASLIIAGVLLHRQSQKSDQPTMTQITWAERELRLTAAAISPSGTYTAYANAEGIFLRTASGDTRPLPAPDSVIVSRLSWFPNQQVLLASGSDTKTHDLVIWRISTREEAPVKMFTGAKQGTVSLDGKRIAFITLDRSEVQVADADGKAPKTIARAVSQDSFSEIVWLGGHSRFLGVQRNTGTHLEPGPFHNFDSIDVSTGRLVDRISSLWVDSATSTSNEGMMFLRYYLDKQHYRQKDQLWQLNTDPNKGSFGSYRMVADLANPPAFNEHVTQLTSTADGRRVVLLKGPDGCSIFSADFAPNPPQFVNIRRVTFDSRTSFPHSWTMDSRAIIFESDRSGISGIFKLTLGFQTPKALFVSQPLKFMPQATTDGLWVLYFRRQSTENPSLNMLMRVSVDGGAETEVPLGGYLDEFRCGMRSGAGCVLRDTIAKTWYVFSELDPETGRGRELGRTKWTPSLLGDWALSPDGATVAIPIHSSRGAKIRLLSLAVRKADRIEREFVIPGLPELIGLQWATAREGWFATANTNLERSIFFIAPDGKANPLQSVDGWAIPSPDGRRVALMNGNGSTNAWMLERSRPSNKGIFQSVISSLR